MPPLRKRNGRALARPNGASRARERRASLQKAPSGIQGLDEITGGGLPRGRPTLVCGGAGCGKTLFGLEFLIRGAVDHGEPGVFVSFEESEHEIAANVASLGFDVPRLQSQKKLRVDWIRVERSEIEETGDYDLEGLFVRLQHAVEEVHVGGRLAERRHEGPVVLSNQATPRVVALYRKLGYDIRFFDAPRRISCTGDRRPAREVLATRNV